MVEARAIRIVRVRQGGWRTRRWSSNRYAHRTTTAICSTRKTAASTSTVKRDSRKYSRVREDFCGSSPKATACGHSTRIVRVCSLRRRPRMAVVAWVARVVVLSALRAALVTIVNCPRRRNRLPPCASSTVASSVRLTSPVSCPIRTTARRIISAMRAKIK